METSHVLQFWGKARPPGDGGHGWHPVAYHLLDVAASADALLAMRPVTRARAARLLGLSEGDAHQLLVAFIALHDIGKFAPQFQLLAAPRDWCWPTVLQGVDATRLERSVHTADGLHLWHRVLRERLSERLWIGGGRVLEALECAVFAHHGRPVNLHPDNIATRFPDGAQRAAEQCADLVLDCVLPQPVTAPPPRLSQVRVASWWVAGFTTVADWIGSRTEWFPYRAPIVGDDKLAAYWIHARSLAREAVRSAGMDGMPFGVTRSFTELTGKSTPSPMQQWASTVELPEGPVLAIIEDATGAGKTEAAHMLVHRLMAAGRASGAYWAMPTQATANAMYERQRKAIAALFPAELERLPSLTLGHGQASLHEGYRATVLSEDSSPGTVPGGSEWSDSADGDLSAAVACSAFLADDRRAALLADIGAGTVDQALLGILPARFNAVRLFAISEKVLVLDEVHAFDAYMSAETRNLLRFQSALGGSAILLSATVPEGKRRAFEDSWRVPQDEELESTNAELDASPYPLATLVSASHATAQRDATGAAPWTVRRVPMRRVHSMKDALAHVLAVARSGGAVVWIRNTVDECLAAALAVEAEGITPLVFHARFAQGDRQRVESEVMRRFGEHSTREERAGRVLIATQVVEQSLDLDFDAMVSDLAPIDLLIQRAGRLWRHSRGEAARPVGLHAELVVLCPEDSADVDAKWPGPLLPKLKYVYPHVGVLWRTAELLRLGRLIEAPENLRVLIRDVYEGEDVPDALQHAVNSAEGDELSQEGIASYLALKLRAGYVVGRAWSDDLRARTRLGEEQVPVRLAKLQGDRLVPWHEDESAPEWKRWLLSEVKLSGRRIPATAVPSGKWRPLVEAVRQGWKRFERDTRVLPLEPDAAGEWCGELPKTSGTGVTSLRYSRTLGLEYGK